MRSDKKRTKRGSKNAANILITFILAAGVFIYLLFANVILPPSGAIAADRQTTVTIAENQTASAEEPLNLSNDTRPDIGPRLVPTPVENIIDTGYLALINGRHPVPSVSDPELLVSAWPSVPVGAIDETYLHPTALLAITDMIDDFRSAGIGTIYVSSGFRDYDAQAALYDGDTDGNFTLPPGHSEHHTGLAADIMALGVAQSEFGSSPQGRWLADNSYKFGLILRYPDGAEDLTGIGYEPWHFRYVGTVHAGYMRENNLVLEEYIRLVRSKGCFTFENDGVIYYIMYQTPENGMIYTPDEMELTISGDNAGGYIVTAWTDER